MAGASQNHNALGLSGTPHKSRPYTVHEESPTAAPTTPTRKKYPDTLSRVLGANRPHQRGSSKQYETLEDLLTAAGYKETRIFTPETDRVQPPSSPKAGKVVGNGRSNSGIGHIVTNFLSAWMPGASVSLGRANGAAIARRDASGPQENDEHDLEGGENTVPQGLQSPLAHKSMRNAQNSRIIPRASSSRPRPNLPPDFIIDARTTLPNPNTRLSYASNSKSTSELRLPPHLRQAASSPNLQRQALTRRTTQLSQGSTASPDSPNTNYHFPRGRQADSVGAYGARQPLPRISTSIPPRRRRSHRYQENMIPPNITTSGVPLTPLLKKADVVCRSTPGSRSASRARSSSSAHVPPLPPVLSPTLVDEELAAWLHKPRSDVERNRLESRDHNADANENMDDDDDGADPDLERLLTSRILHDASPQLGSSPDAHSFLRVASPSPPASEGGGAARRQRSIQSLRAHLVPRPSHTLRKRPSFRNPIFMVATPRTAEAGLPGRAVWLDGPEWDGAVHKPPNGHDAGRGRRGLIPWFGGERAFLEDENVANRRADPEWDG